MDAASIKQERTLVLLKPDAVARGLVGEITARFERAGLKIVAMKMVQPTAEKAAGHYSGPDAWISGMGQKTLDSFEEFGMDVEEVLETTDPFEIGTMVHSWLVDYVSSGPNVAMVLEGVHAIAAVRRLIGFTIPSRAEPGTIRGDFSIDSNTISSLEKRATKNLVHASGNPEEAAQEIAVWFDTDEIVAYARPDASAMF
ncbi:MAG: nucleoside-diphosphate kinase [Anaerolineae bacterium]|nr:nucleoside-diphosphate kinase [Anaerolineae bacterium]